mgnify:CR=1 FL=1
MPILYLKQFIYNILKGGNKELFFIALLTFLVRIITAFFTDGLFHPQTFEYEQLANNILKGKGYMAELDGTIYFSMMYPFYPYFNAVIYFITNHSQSAIIFAQILISCFSSIMLVLIGRRLIKPPGSLISGLIASFHPALIVYSSNKIHEINLVILFILCNIYFIFLILKNFSYWKVFWISPLFVASIFTRVTLIFFPFLLIILLPGKIQRKINTFFLLGLFCFSFVLMWNYRNYKIHGKFVFSTMNAYNLYMGNNTDATGTEFSKSNQSIRAVIQQKNKLLRNLDESQQYDYFKYHAIEFIKENPSRFIRLTFARLYYFWWFSPHTGLEYPTYYFTVYKIFYIYILLAAMIGIYDPYLYKTEDQRIMLLIILIALLVICSVQSLVYVHYRHRASIELLITLFAANGINRLLIWVKGFLIGRKGIYAKL